MIKAIGNPINRRSLAAVVPALIGAAIAAPAVASANSSLATLDREADAITAHKAALNANFDATEAEWDEYFEREKALVRRVMALPVTRENAVLKARAFEMLHDGDWSGLEADAAGWLPKELATQVLRAMAGAA